MAQPGLVVRSKKRRVSKQEVDPFTSVKTYLSLSGKHYKGFNINIIADYKSKASKG